MQLKPAGPGQCTGLGTAWLGQLGSYWDHTPDCGRRRRWGLFVRFLLPPLVLQFGPSSASPAPGLPATDCASWAHREFGHSREQPGSRRPGAAPSSPAFRGGPLAPEGSSSPCASLPTQTHPLLTHTPPHTLSHSLSCCLKQVEDLCNDIMPFNKNFMRCI